MFFVKSGRGLENLPAVVLIAVAVSEVLKARIFCCLLSLIGVRRIL
jgi:hypothetical protein